MSIVVLCQDQGVRAVDHSCFMHEETMGHLDCRCYFFLPRPRVKDGALTWGFTLLEMTLVVAILLVLLASIAAPHYQRTLPFAHEARLRDDLFTMRSMIDRFTLDKKPPRIAQ